ncbi:hypothetical protein V2G26_002017 [Clonostachys chloroleuca]
MSAQHTRVARSSLACLPCRSRHLKCDGKRPFCSRCTSAGKPCQYAKSRRGGLDRAALAARREAQLAQKSSTTSASSLPPTNTSSDTISVSCVLESPPLTVDLESLSSEVVLEANHDAEAFDIDQDWLGSSTLSPAALPSPPIDINGDLLLEAYYNRFHAFHPCVLPKRDLERLSHNPDICSRLAPVLAVIRMIGAVYTRSPDLNQLRDHLHDCLLKAKPNDPFIVQARLLYSIPLYWQGDKVSAQQQMDSAISIARQLGMFQKEFATENGFGEPVLQESWRRTWWQLYIVDGFYAGTTKTTPFETKDIEATVELPCQEGEYESGIIPPSKTLDDFDSREFAFEKHDYSSFAYLIGSVRCAALASDVVTKGLSSNSDPVIVDSADSIIEGYLLLLPEERKQVISKNGEMDELMFQAIMAINAAIIGLHRPFSDLRFNPVESVSSCSTDPPSNSSSSELVNIHTVRSLQAIQSQVRLLALPVRPFCHTPFVTCMMSVGTLGLLSACKFLYKGQELAVARDRIRMAIGCLRAIGDIWPQTARNLQEIQTIARDVLGISPKTIPGVQYPGKEKSPSINEGMPDPTKPLADLTSGFTPWDTLEELEPDMCLWFNLGTTDR